MPKQSCKQVAKKPSARDIQYTRALAKILIATAVSNRALFTHDLTMDAVYKIIRRALKAGHIKEMTYRERAVDRYHTYSYYTITAKGIQFIAEQHYYPWSDYLPEDLRSVSIFSSGRKPADIANAVRRGDTLLLALNAGAGVSEFLFSGQLTEIENEEDSYVEYQADEKLQINDSELQELSDDLCSDDLCSILDQCEDTEITLDDNQTDDNEQVIRMPLTEVKNETINNMKAALGKHPIIETTEMTFIPTNEYKAILYHNTNSAIKKPDFRFGRYTGVLVTPATCILLYHDDHDGIRWDNRVEKIDINTLCQFSRCCTPYKNVAQGNLRCGIIVSNPISFRNVITDRYHKRREKTELGRMFNSVYLIPQSPNGASLLSWIAMNEPNAKRAYVDSVISQHHSIAVNKDNRRDAFRLTCNGHYLMDGFEMDFKVISAAIRIKESVPQLEYSVICFRWQEEYYQKLWPGIEMIWID